MERKGLKSPAKTEKVVNVSKTNRDGGGMQYVNYNPATARLLVGVPGFSGYIVNKRSGIEGLKNFLRYEGLKEREIKKIVREVELDPIISLGSSRPLISENVEN